MKTKTKILVITGQNDRHADFICQKLKQKHFRLNTNLLREMSYYLNAVDGKLFINRQELADDIETVWFRRPFIPRLENQDNGVQEFYQNEWTAFLDNLWTTFNCRWISPIESLTKAKNKFSQLRQAKQVGLKIPETLISNDLLKIKDFFEKTKGQVLVKSLKTQIIEENECLALIRAKKLRKQDLKNPALYFTPIIFQEILPRQMEIRIVAMGEKLFAFGIRPKTNKKYIDIKRHSLESLEHFPYELSKDLEIKIKALLKSYNLPFSSMDFILTPGGEEFFLDLNPNGQWLWLEFMTKVPLSDYFVEFLTQ